MIHSVKQCIRDAYTFSASFEQHTTPRLSLRAPKLRTLYRQVYTGSAPRICYMQAINPYPQRTCTRLIIDREYVSSPYVFASYT